MYSHPYAYTCSLTSWHIHVLPHMYSHSHAYIYILTHMYTHALPLTCIHIYSSSHVHTRTPTYMYTHAHTLACPHMHSHPHVHTCTPTHMYTHALTLTCIHMYLHSHAHTCTPTNMLIRVLPLAYTQMYLRSHAGDAALPALHCTHCTHTDMYTPQLLNTSPPRLMWDNNPSTFTYDVPHTQHTHGPLSTTSPPAQAAPHYTQRRAPRCPPHPCYWDLSVAMPCLASEIEPLSARPLRGVERLADPLKRTMHFNV